MQHPVLPLANVIHRSLASAKWNRQNKEQNDEAHQKGRRCRPVTPVNKVGNGEQREGFDRGRYCNQRACQELPAVAQAEKSTQHEREQYKTGLAEMITRPDKWHQDEIRNNNRRVSLFRNQRAGTPDAQEPRDGVN